MNAAAVIVVAVADVGIVTAISFGLRKSTNKLP